MNVPSSPSLVSRVIYWLSPKLPLMIPFHVIGFFALVVLPWALEFT